MVVAVDVINIHTYVHTFIKTAFHSLPFEVSIISSDIDVNCPVAISLYDKHKTTIDAHARPQIRLVFHVSGYQ